MPIALKVAGLALSDSGLAAARGSRWNDVFVFRVGSSGRLCHKFAQAHFRHFGPFFHNLLGVSALSLGESNSNSITSNESSW